MGANKSASFGDLLVGTGKGPSFLYGTGVSKNHVEKCNSFIQSHNHLADPLPVRSFGDLLGTGKDDSSFGDLLGTGKDDSLFGDLLGAGKGDAFGDRLSAGKITVQSMGQKPLRKFNNSCSKTKPYKFAPCFK